MTTRTSRRDMTSSISLAEASVSAPFFLPFNTKNELPQRKGYRRRQNLSEELPLASLVDLHVEDYRVGGLNLHLTDDQPREPG